MQEEKTQTTYLALTIGPIYRILHTLRSTKAIWAGSYFFSWMMREIMNEFTQKQGKRAFLMPFIAYADHKTIAWDLPENVGLIPDKLMLVQENETDFEALLAAKDAVITQLSEKMVVDLSKNLAHNHKVTNKERAFFKNIEVKTVQTYLERYLQIYLVQMELSDNGVNIVEEINKGLDVLELETNFANEETHDFLFHFFENVYYNFLIGADKKRFGERGIPSVIEVAAAQFKADFYELDKTEKDTGKKRDSTDIQEKIIYDLFKKKGTDVKFHHKYLAIVQADGDNMGAFIASLFADSTKSKDEKQVQFQTFSKQLYTFAKEASVLVSEFGGLPVYAGGDDLLFFAPVSMGNKKTIMTLIQGIDALFKSYISIPFQAEIARLEAQNKKAPSMSYGISISYYKHPLNEALEEAFEKLNVTAKKTNHKNAIAYSTLKHSGQFFGATFCKSNPSFACFNELLAMPYEEQFIAGVMHKLDNFKAILGLVEKNDSATTTWLIVADKSYLETFFKQNFNEMIHEKRRDYLDKVVELIYCVFKEGEPTEKKEEQERAKIIDNNLNQLRGALRFLQFIHAKY